MFRQKPLTLVDDVVLPDASVMYRQRCLYPTEELCNSAALTSSFQSLIDRVATLSASAAATIAAHSVGAKASSGSPQAAPAAPSPSVTGFAAQSRAVSIFMNPERPSYSIIALLKLVHSHIHLTVHQHSDIAAVLPCGAHGVSATPGTASADKLRVMFIWRNVCQPRIVMNVFGVSPISGSSNVLRFVARLLGQPDYENHGALHATRIDFWLDEATALPNRSSKHLLDSLSAAESQLKSTQFLAGTSFSIADLALWGALKVTDEGPLSVLPATKAWYERVTKHLA